MRPWEDNWEVDYKTVLGMEWEAQFAHPEDAELAAAAPDMYRTLISVEWKGGACVWCEEPKSKGHSIDCELAMVLMKARGE